MSVLVAFFLMVAAVAYVGYPLLKREPDAWPVYIGVAPETLIADGVTYESADEWAVDRALDKVGEGEPDPAYGRWQAGLERDIERQVTALRKERKAGKETRKRPVCPNCGRPFQAGDRFCAHCGGPHPNTCPQCGEHYRVGDQFCTSCGMALPGGQG